jgi:hypothetical protein
MHRLTAGTHNHHRVACSLAALALVVSGAVSQPQLNLTFVLPYHDARIALSNLCLCNNDAFRCGIDYVLVTVSMSFVERYEMQLWQHCRRVRCTQKSHLLPSSLAEPFAIVRLLFCSLMTLDIHLLEVLADFLRNLLDRIRLLPGSLVVSFFLHVVH